MTIGLDVDRIEKHPSLSRILDKDQINLLRPCILMGGHRILTSVYHNNHN